MSLFSNLFSSSENSSASRAKDRLTIVIETDRKNIAYPFLNALKQDILKVVERYVSAHDVNIRKGEVDGRDMLEVEIKLPHQ
jgi:cell division topological specificity factor